MWWWRKRVSRWSSWQAGKGSEWGYYSFFCLFSFTAPFSITLRFGEFLKDRRLPVHSIVSIGFRVSRMYSSFLSFSSVEESDTILYINSFLSILTLFHRWIVFWKKCWPLISFLYCRLISRSNIFLSLVDLLPFTGKFFTYLWLR